jgi:uncharacterized protein (TIGR04222 family)
MADDAVVLHWGVDALVFLIGYGIVGAMLLTPALIHLVHTRLWTRPVDVDTLSPHAVGYLSGGAGRAVQTSLAWLRAGAAINADAGGLHSVTHTAPWGAVALDRAVFRAAHRDTAVTALLADPWVRRAVRELRRRLEGADLATRATLRRAVMVGTILLTAVGAVRYFDGLFLGHQDEWLAYVTIALGSAGIAIVYALTRITTATGRYALAQLSHRPVAGSRDPSDPYQVAMLIARSGPREMADVDHNFAVNARFVMPVHPYAGIDLTGGSGPMAGYRGGNFAGLGDGGGGAGGGGGGGGGDGGGGGG